MPSISRLTQYLLLIPVLVSLNACIGAIMGPPKKVQATDGAGNAVTVNWVADAKATSYWVFRADEKYGLYQKVGESTTTQFVDSSVSSGVVYYYRVQSANVDGKSIYSNTDAGFGGQLSPLGLYEQIKGNISTVWARIDQSSFQFPLEIYGKSGSAYVNVAGQNAGQLLISLKFNGFSDGLYTLNGALMVTVDQKNQGTETGTLSISGAHTGQIKFFVNIGPRFDGHSSEVGGYYLISVNGVTDQRVNWRPIITIPTPSNLKASISEHPDKIVVKWDSIINDIILAKEEKASYFKLYRSTSSFFTDYVVLDDYVPNQIFSVITFEDKTVDTRVNYYYKIQAFNPYGESRVSNWAMGSTL